MLDFAHRQYFVCSCLAILKVPSCSHVLVFHFFFLMI